MKCFAVALLSGPGSQQKRSRVGEECGEEQASERTLTCPGSIPGLSGRGLRRTLLAGDKAFGFVRRGLMCVRVWVVISGKKGRRLLLLWLYYCMARHISTFLEN